MVSPVGRSLLVDVGEASWDEVDGALTVGAYIQNTLGCKHIDYVLITHFHLDHAGIPGHGGLWHLTQVQGFTVGKLVHRDFNALHGNVGGGVVNWKSFLESTAGQRLHPESAQVGKRVFELGGGLDIQVVAANGDLNLPIEGGALRTPLSDENDASIALLLRFGLLDYLTAGDLSGEDYEGQGYRYSDMETNLAKMVRDVDVYRVSHHGSRHSSNETFLAQMQPRVSILQVGNDNTNGHPHQSVVDRLQTRSQLYLTQMGAPGVHLRAARAMGTIVLRSWNGREYSVCGDAFRATDPPRTDADGDGYFSEADPDDRNAEIVPARNVSAL
jgi:ribonuclease BN (tRNA processing enzyme)